MTFNEPEVVKMGLAEDLIQEVLSMENTEGIPDGFPPARVKSAVYVADAEQQVSRGRVLYEAPC